MEYSTKRSCLAMRSCLKVTRYHQVRAQCIFSPFLELARRDGTASRAWATRACAEGWHCRSSLRQSGPIFQSTASQCHTVRCITIFRWIRFLFVVIHCMCFVCVFRNLPATHTCTHLIHRSNTPFKTSCACTWYVSEVIVPTL